MLEISNFIKSFVEQINKNYVQNFGDFRDRHASVIFKARLVYISLILAYLISKTIKINP